MRKRDFYSVRFGYWLLKKAIPVHSIRKGLCWAYCGSHYTTTELYDVFLANKENISKHLDGDFQKVLNSTSKKVSKTKSSKRRK